MASPNNVEFESAVRCGEIMYMYRNAHNRFTVAR